MKVYLGDAVYASYDGHGIVLTTEDGVRVTNRIVLEPKVYVALVEYHDSLRVKEGSQNMAYKDNCSCLNKVGPSEPIFVLRAQDKLAPMVIRTWMFWAKVAGTPQEKLDAAEACACEMEKWSKTKFPD